MSYNNPRSIDRSIDCSSSQARDHRSRTTNVPSSTFVMHDAEYVNNGKCKLDVSVVKTFLCAVCIHEYVHVWVQPNAAHYTFRYIKILLRKKSWHGCVQHDCERFHVELGRFGGGGGTRRARVCHLACNMAACQEEEKETVKDSKSRMVANLKLPKVPCCCHNRATLRRKHCTGYSKKRNLIV